MRRGLENKRPIINIEVIKTAKFHTMIPWEIGATTFFPATTLNKTVIIFIIYLFISSTCHCRTIYNATDQVQVQESPPAAPHLSHGSSSSRSYVNISSSNNNGSSNYNNVQLRNNTSKIVRVIVTKSSSTSYSAPDPTAAGFAAGKKTRVNENHFSHFDSLHDEHFPDLSRLFSSTSATASSVTQSSSTTPAVVPILPFRRSRPRTRTRSFTRTAVTSTTTPTPTTYHPDFFFSPFYSNINRMHSKRKIENRSINKGHMGNLASFPDYQNHPDNIFSVFYHAFSQQGSPTGSFSFHSQSQQHHHLHHSPNTFPKRNFDSSNPTIVRTEQHQLLSFPQTVSNEKRENSEIKHGIESIVIPTLPTATTNGQDSQLEGSAGSQVSVVSESRSLTAASTAATLSAESRSVSAASTRASSSIASRPDSLSSTQFISQESINEPIASALSSDDSYEKTRESNESGFRPIRRQRVRQSVYPQSQDSEIPDFNSASLEVHSDENSSQVTQIAGSADVNPTVNPEGLTQAQWRDSEPQEQSWGEPERQWGEQEHVWGEPERVWGRPETSSPPKLFTWPSERQAKMSHANLRQLFQRDLSLPSLIHAGGPKIYEIESKVAHITPKAEIFSTTSAERRQDTNEEDLEFLDEETDNAKFYEIGEDEEDEPKELNLDENTMNSTIENAQLAARSWELPELTPSSSLMSPLHHTSSTMPEAGVEMAAESVQIPRNYQNEHKDVNSNPHANPTQKTIGDKTEFGDRKPEPGAGADEQNLKAAAANEDEAAEKSGNEFESQKTSHHLPNGNTLSTSERPGKKFGYVLDGSDVRKYRVEERTPDGYIVGEYGVINHDNGFLRGVRYTADGTINPRLIHQALMKFLSL